MRSIFRFSNFDHLIPLSEQCKQISELKKSEDILRYSVTAILAAQPKVDEVETIYDWKLKMLLQSHRNAPGSLHLKLLKENQTQTTLADPEAINESTLKFSSDLLSSSVESFEYLWKIVDYNKGDCMKRENIDWIKNQTEKLILDNELNLYYLAMIYKNLSEYNVHYSEIRQFYDSLISIYLHSFLPEELAIVLKAFSQTKLLDKSTLPWINDLKNSFNNYSNFANEHLASIVFSLNSIGINTKFPASKIESIKDSDLVNPYIFYVMIKSNNLKLTENKFTDLINKMDIDTQLDFLEVIDFAKVDEEYIRILIESISSYKGKLDLKKIYLLSSIVFKKAQNMPYLYNMIQSYTPYIKSMNLYEYGRYLEIICLLKSDDYIIPNESLDIITSKFYEIKDQIHPYNIQVLVHFFAYNYPNKAIHKILCNKILENEQNDTVEKYAPEHCYYYLKGEGEYLVLNNHLLNALSFTSIIDILICLPFRFQIKSDVNKIVKKYLKLILTKYNYRIMIKFRSKLAIMLSTPENFDKELVNLMLDKIHASKLLIKTTSSSYPFMQAINNFKHLEYNHPLFKDLPSPEKILENEVL